MLITRQRLLLTFLDAVGGTMKHTDFQKLLFLYTQECEQTPSYEFVPYRFGGFSFTSCSDKRHLVDAGLLVEDEHLWQLTETGRQLARQRSLDSLQIAPFCRRYSALRGSALVADVYRRYPYYALRSEIVDKVLADPADRARITAERLELSRAPGLLTIGYEGKCLEGYLNQLLRNGVTILCDVRRNPLSRKYGFSKSTLSKGCEGVGIRYRHMPELGIASEERQELKTQADYDALFKKYERDNLPKQTNSLTQIQEWIERDNNRVALTCFERLPHQCHRHCVAEALEQASRGRLSTIHL